MRKIGLICLAVVLAMGALGVGYAMWWDEITITGLVETGNVEISINATSDTYVYKNLTSRDLLMSSVPLDDPELLYVASATATDVSSSTEKKVAMTFDNIFPTTSFIYADVLLHYTGSIPAHVVLLDDEVSPEIAPYLIQEWWAQDAAGGWYMTDPETLQLHYCDYVWLWVALNGTALQAAGEQAQGLSGTFNKTLIVHQFNENWPP
jgi:hypothetical protein